MILTPQKEAEHCCKNKEVASSKASERINGFGKSEIKAYEQVREEVMERKEDVDTISLS